MSASDSKSFSEYSTSTAKRAAPSGALNIPPMPAATPEMTRIRRS